MKMAELIAGLDGPVYVERVALYDAKQRVRAKKAIRKAIKLQVENKGFAFVEVLAECPTHLGMNPSEAEKWVKDKMAAVFPLGVKKDIENRPSTSRPRSPGFEPAHLMEAVEGTHREGAPVLHGLPQRAGEPRTWRSSSRAPEATAPRPRPCWSPARRSTKGSTRPTSPATAPNRAAAPPTPTSTSRAARCSRPPRPPRTCWWRSTRRASPGSVRPCAPGGTVVYDSSVIADVPPLRRGGEGGGRAVTRIATELGRPVVKNVVALGALQAATELFPEETLLTAIRQALKSKCAMIPLNEEAFAWGSQAVEESRVVSRADRTSEAGLGA